MALKETVLQFGSGRFLRAFADLFIHHGNLQGQEIGKIVVVQSMSDDKAGGLNASQGKYHVVVRGIENGQIVDRVEECTSISRAIHAGSQWQNVLELAQSRDLKTVLSNTTEAGYSLDTSDTANISANKAPTSFPAKLLKVLEARWQAGLSGLTIIPCELIEGNASILRATITKLAHDWQLSASLITYIEKECVWLHTLVDRICTGTPAQHPLLAQDPLLICAEPFAFWALEYNPRSAFRLAHPAITYAANVEPYFLRKVRILNAAHTALLIKSRPKNIPIVRDAVNDLELGSWLKKLLAEEIVPTLEGRVEKGAWFAEQTLDRFRNPFLDHKFSDIALHHDSKVKVRLVPTRDEYEARFGKKAVFLNEVLS